MYTKEQVNVIIDQCFYYGKMDHELIHNEHIQFEGGFIVKLIFKNSIQIDIDREIETVHITPSGDRY